MAIGREQVRIVVGIIGNIVTMSRSLSSIPTFWYICKKGSVEEFSVFPYASSVVCSMLWLWYSTPMVTSANLALTTISCIQGSFQATFLAIYFKFASRKQKVKVLWAVLFDLTVIVSTVLLSLFVIHDPLKRKFFVGILAAIASMVLYGSPLSIMGLVIRTKSVEYMPFFLSLTIWLNSCCWVTYGALGRDIFVMIAEGVGVMLGVAQLALYATYYRSTPLPSEKPKNVQETKGAELCLADKDFSSLPQKLADNV